MGRAPCCEKVGLKKGPWTADEDEKLVSYIQKHGHGSWRSLPKNAGLLRCGKSCRLRWTNYLRPDIKRGKFSPEEDQTILNLHAVLGNKWSSIASHLPGRTDNEIKNYWNTHLKKRLLQMGLDPVTHKPLPQAPKIGMSSANLPSYMLQHLQSGTEADNSRLCNLLRQIPHIVSASSGLQNQAGDYLLKSWKSDASEVFSNANPYVNSARNAVTYSGVYGVPACAESSPGLEISQNHLMNKNESSNTLLMQHQYQQKAFEKLLTNSSSSSVIDQVSPTSSLSLQAECPNLYTRARVLKSYNQHTPDEVNCESTVVNTPTGSVLECNTDENNSGESKPQGNLISPEQMTSRTVSAQSELDIKSESHLVYVGEFDELVCTSNWSISADPLGFSCTPVFDTVNQEISAKQNLALDSTKNSYQAVEPQMISNPIFKNEFMVGKHFDNSCDNVSVNGFMPMFTPEVMMDLQSSYHGTLSPNFSTWQDQSIYSSTETGSQNCVFSSIIPASFPFNQTTHHKMTSLPS